MSHTRGHADLSRGMKVFSYESCSFKNLNLKDYVVYHNNNTIIIIILKEIQDTMELRWRPNTIIVDRQGTKQGRAGLRSKFLRRTFKEEMKHLLGGLLPWDSVTSTWW